MIAQELDRLRCRYRNQELIKRTVRTTLIVGQDPMICCPEMRAMRVCETTVSPSPN